MSWPQVPLSDVAVVLRGVTYKKAQASDSPFDGSVPLVRATNIKDSLNVDDGLVHVPSSVVKPSQMLVPGDIVLASSSGSLSVVGKSALHQRDWRGTFGAFCAVVRSSNRIDAQFLALYLQSREVRSRWSEAARGTNINNLKRSDLERTLVPLPSLVEQRRIVDILEDHLSSVDAADASLLRVTTYLNRLRESTVMRALTGAELPDRVPAVLTDAGTADGDLPSLPRGWSWARLGDVAEVVGGVTKDAKKQSDPTYVDVPYLRVANVQRGRLELRDVTTIRLAPTKAEALRLHPGDVLLNEGGDRDKLARGWVWEGQIDHCIHQNHVFRARIVDPRIDPYFLSWTANTFGGRWAERNGKQSVNLASISLSMIRKMPVIVPVDGQSTRIAKLISEQLSSHDRLAAAVADARRRGRALRQALLAAAFSGRLRAPCEAQTVAEETVA